MVPQVDRPELSMEQCQLKENDRYKLKNRYIGNNFMDSTLP